MSEPNNDPIPKLKGLPRKVWVSIIAGLAILVVLPFSLIQLQRQLNWEQKGTVAATDKERAKKADAPEEDSGDESPEISSDESPLDLAEPAPPAPIDSISVQNDALRQAKLLRIRKQGERIQQKWEELSVAQSGLSLSLTAMTSDELGSKIAANPELIDKYVVLQERAIPATDVTAELGEELTILLAPLDAIEATQIQSEFTAALDDLAQRIDTQLTAVKRDQRMLNALQSVAATRDASGKMLADAIEQRQNQLAQDQMTEIVKASATARQAELERVAKESAEEQRKILEAEREVERLKEQQRLDELNAQKEARQAAITKAALEREFQRDLPQIRSLLRPLITEGLTQPGKNGFVPADKKEPVSLAKLRGTGSLGPTAKARAGLYYIVGNMRDRDLGSFPRYTGGAQDVQSKQSTMMRVQELVNKYGELMVEKGMMAE